MDDAVLSCGGLIYQLVQAGESVTVFTRDGGAVCRRTYTITPVYRGTFPALETLAGSGAGP